MAAIVSSSYRIVQARYDTYYDYPTTSSKASTNQSFKANIFLNEILQVVLPYYKTT